MNNFSRNRWYTVPATSVDVRSWSGEAVKCVEELYEERIFGSQPAPKCGCGRLFGEEKLDQLCPNCGYYVRIDPWSPWYSRIGRVELATPIEHPLQGVRTYGFDVGASVLETFPIAPLMFRRKADGTINVLGKKYEALIARNCAMRVPSSDAQSFAVNTDSGSVGGTGLQDIVRDIIGGPDRRDGEHGGTLIDLIVRSLFDLDGHLQTLIRCCACSVFVETKI